MRKVNFNSGWMFYKETQPENVKMINLPHDAQLTEKRSPELSMDSGYFPGGKYHYSKPFVWHATDDEKTVLLEFDGVYMNAEILVNGKRVAFQPGGYTNFVVPIGDDLKPGENLIEVIADNSQFPNSRWYTGAGIYRDVALHLAGTKFISPFGVKIDTLDYKRGEIFIHIDTSNAEGCTARTEILLNKEVVAAATGFETALQIPAHLLWSAEHPNLYSAHVRLFDNGVVIDETVQNFGIRTIEWGASFGLKVNGEKVLLRGGCVHHDNGILGAAAFFDAEERKVRLLKEAGFNAVRSSHNMCSMAMLKACDKYGMYLMDEFSDMWTQHKHKYDYAVYFKDWYEHDLTAMVAKDYNHPSVILYSIGNEVGESATSEGIEYAKKMVTLLHSLDSSRPVTCGINLLLNGLVSMGKGLYQDDGIVMEKEKNEEKKESGSTFVNGVINHMGGIINFVGRLKKFDLATRDVFAQLDIAGYNYGSGRYPMDPKKYPARITVGSETLPPYLYKNWQAVKKYPNLIGDFMWSAWDYLGEAGLSIAAYGENDTAFKAYPALLSGAGLIEITGEFRPEVYWARSVWGLDVKPYLAVEPLTHAGEKVSYGMWRDTDARHSWAWPGCEGKATTVKVYTSANKVKLYLNKQCIGTKKVKNCMATFKNIVYAAGELKAIAYDVNGEFEGEDVLLSAQDAVVLKLTPEQERIKEGRLVYVNITLVDNRGIRVFSQEKKISVTVDGGTLLALGSANPCTEENFCAAEHTTYNGLVQAVIMPAPGQSALSIKAVSNGLTGDMLTLQK